MENREISECREIRECMKCIEIRECLECMEDGEIQRVHGEQGDCRVQGVREISAKSARKECMGNAWRTGRMKSGENRELI